MYGLTRRSRKKSRFLETNESENTMTQYLWDTARAVLRGKLSNSGLPQETGKISNKQSKLTPKGTQKRTNRAQS